MKLHCKMCDNVSQTLPLCQYVVISTQPTTVPRRMRRRNPRALWHLILPQLMIPHRNVNPTDREMLVSHRAHPDREVYGEAWRHDEVYRSQCCSSLFRIQTEQRDCLRLTCKPDDLRNRDLISFSEARCFACQRASSFPYESKMICASDSLFPFRKWDDLRRWFAYQRASSFSLGSKTIYASESLFPFRE